MKLCETVTVIIIIILSYHTAVLTIELPLKLGGSYSLYIFVI